MRKQEQRLWDTMTRNRPSGFWLERIENLVGDGIPDVRGVTRHGEEFWVELKAPKRPARPTTRLLGDEGLRESQVNWHLKAAHYGMRAYTLIRDDTSALFLIPSKAELIDELNDLPALDLEIASVADTWESIFEELAR